MSDDSLFTQDLIEFMDNTEWRLKELEDFITKLDGRLNLLSEVVFKLWGLKEAQTDGSNSGALVPKDTKEGRA
ncbi:MAG: hypothetical protein ABC596_09340 [Candidatus Methanosuratincola petrocarbonis]